MSIKIFIGVDVGFDGGIAILKFVDNNLDSYYLIKIPVIIEMFLKNSKKRKRKILDIIKLVQQLITILTNLQSESTKTEFYVFIEKVHARPNQGVVSMFRFGEQLGLIEGMFVTLKEAIIKSMKIEFLTPIQWKRLLDFELGVDKKEGKQFAKDFVEAITGKGIRHSGLADAFCIAYAGFKKVLGEDK